MTPDNLSLIYGVGLMLFFALFGYFMTQVEATPCPWETETEPELRPNAYEAWRAIHPRTHHS
ncbi:MAG: hypothetical protein ABI743_11105 [bacterium]